MTDTQRNKQNRNQEQRNRNSSFSYLDFPALQSDICLHEAGSAKHTEGGFTQMNAIQLLSAKEAGQVLGVNPNVVYTLWKKNLLDFWSIHGTKKTNMDAIASFLEKTRNQELQLDT